MPYDATSFKAGFALGRMLWRPPMPTVAYTDVGLGWKAKTEYLRWYAGVMGTYDPGVLPSYVYVDYHDASHPAWVVTDHRVEFQLSNVTSPVYWMYTRTTHPTRGWPAYSIIAISLAPFTMNMTGYSATAASKPPVYAPNYVTSHSGFDAWGDCYGIVMGWAYENPWHGADWWEQVPWDSVTSTALHNAVLEHPQIKTVSKTNNGASVNAFVRFPVSGAYKYVGVGLSTKASYAHVNVDNSTVSSTTRTLNSLAFTMYYTDQLDGDDKLISYVPVIAVDSVPSISDLSDYQTAIFNAVVDAAGIEYMQIDTGLGWSADVNYLVNAYGTKIATVSGRLFTKVGDGYAIAVNCVNSNGYSGPALFSTVSANTDYTPPGGVSGGSSTTYLGMTWYMSQTTYWLQGSVYNSGGVAPDYDFTGVPQIIEDMLPLVCAAAGVTVTGGGS